MEKEMKININNVKYSHIIHFPMYSFESTINKEVSKISQIQNFDSKVNEYSLYKLDIAYKGKLLSWVGPVTINVSENKHALVASIVFPRNLTYDIPLEHLIGFPFVVTISEGNAGEEVYKHFYYTLRIISKDLILVDLGIIGPPSQCPSKKWSKYMDKLEDYLDKQRDCWKCQMPTPDFCEIYSSEDALTINPGYSFLYTFLVNNSYDTLGDLMLGVDEIMTSIEKDIIKKI